MSEGKPTSEPMRHPDIHVLNTNGGSGDAADSKQEHAGRNSFSSQTSSRYRISEHRNSNSIGTDQSSRGIKRAREVSSNSVARSLGTEHGSPPTKNAREKKDADEDFFNMVFESHMSPKPSPSKSKHTVSGKLSDRRFQSLISRDVSDSIKQSEPKKCGADLLVQRPPILGENEAKEVPKIKAGLEIIDSDSSDDEWDKKKTVTKLSKSLGSSVGETASLGTKNAPQRDNDIKGGPSNDCSRNGSTPPICLEGDGKGHSKKETPKVPASVTALLASITARKRISMGLSEAKRNDCDQGKEAELEEKDVICLDDSSDEDTSTSHAKSQMQTARSSQPMVIKQFKKSRSSDTSKPAVQNPHTSSIQCKQSSDALKGQSPKMSSIQCTQLNDTSTAAVQSPGTSSIQASRALESIPSTENQQSVDISWHNIPPGLNDPSSTTRNGIQWHWCELCNNDKGRWSTHSTENHKLGKFSFVSQHSADVTKSASSEQSPFSSNFGNSCNDPICILSSDDEAPIDRRHFSSAVRRVAKKSPKKPPIELPTKNSSTNNMKTELESKSTGVMGDIKGARRPIYIDLLDSDDESMGHESIVQKRDLGENNKSSTDENEKCLALPDVNMGYTGDGKGDTFSALECSALPDVNMGYTGDGKGATFSALESPASPNNSDAKKAHTEAMQILVSAEKELQREIQVPIKFAVVEEDKRYATDFAYCTMRQYICDMFNDEDGRQKSGFGCLKCFHCGKTSSAKTASSMKNQLSMYWKHLDVQCEKVPKNITNALNCLKQNDAEQRRADSNIAIQKFMGAVFKHMVSAGIVRPDEHDSENEDDHVSPMCEDSYEGDVHSSYSSKNHESMPGYELPEMRVIDWQKSLDKNHYPTVTFTAWNEEKDRLFDFKAFIGPSHIPNSGNGAFLQLLHARVRKPGVDSVPLIRCPLLMVDEHGKERKVFVGPETIHDHDGPSHDSLYVENNDLTFSSWDDGCGSIDIGSYGPFFESDIKNEIQYDFKNFLFDFEPQGWSYGLNTDGEGEDLVLDITNDETGETHLRARENIPMHVNEVGHNPDLKQNVTPLEPDNGIHYYVHPKTPMKVGEAIELLVDYGEIYEEVRERKGYGKSNLGCDNTESQRVKRNQGERVKIEDTIVTQSLEEIFDLLVSLQGTINAVIDKTNKFLTHQVILPEMIRCWKARFRIHCIERTFRHRCKAIRTRSDDGICVAIFLYLDKMKFPNDPIFFDMMRNSTLSSIAKNEFLEESVLAASRRHRLLHPLDPTMWCDFARKLVQDLGEDLVLDIKARVISDADAVKRVYSCAKKASEDISQLCTFPAEIWKLSFEKTDNACVVNYLTNSPGAVNQEGSKTFLEECDYSGRELTEVAALERERKYWVRWTLPEGSGAVIDKKWYLLWQVIRVVHVLVKQCLPSKKWDYSLETLCENVGIDLSDAERILNTKMVEPYDEEHYVSLHFARKNRSMQIRQPKGRIPKMISENIMNILNQKGGRQKSEFIPNVHPNVVRNRDNITFWKEEPGGDEYPEGWIIHTHKRLSGATGTGGRHIDRYWYTKEGKKLRSTKEIERFIVALRLSEGKEGLAIKVFEGKIAPSSLGKGGT